MQLSPHNKARILGTDCANCPLCALPAVKQTRQDSILTIVGEAPGANEVDKGEFFVGMTGQFVAAMVAKTGLAWGLVNKTNVLCCQPDRILSPAEWKQAARCCAPNLIRSIGEPKVVLLLGKQAALQVAGKTSLLNWLGGPIHGQGDYARHMMLCSPHPAFAMRKGARHWLPAIGNFVTRAAALATGKIKPWTWPTGFIEPDKHMLEALRSLQHADHVCVDVECANTTRQAKMLAVGIGTFDVAVSLPWDAYNTEVGLSATSIGRRCEILARRILANASIAKVYQNGLYDTTALANHGIEVTNFAHDLMYMHATYAPRLPHRLGFLMALESAVEPWKAIYHVGSHEEERDPTGLRLYNLKDIQATDYLYPRLLAKVSKEPYLQRNYADLMTMGLEATRMHQEGIAINDSARAQHRSALVSRSQRAYRQAKRLARRMNLPRFNPRSSRDLQQLFAGRLHQTLDTTDVSHQAKLDKKALTKLLTASGAFTRRLARVLLRLRKWDAIGKQHVIKLQVIDGIVHPNWKPHAAVTGRWSCDSPNLMVVPKALEQRLKHVNKAGKAVIKVYPSLRNMYVARRGLVLVKADYKAQELRMVALHAGAKKLIEWFTAEQDVHTKHAQMLYKIDKPSKHERTLIKNFIFNCMYLGSAETIHQLLVVTFPKLSVAEVRYMMRWVFDLHPEIPRWHRRIVTTAEKTDYSVEPFSGRRRYFYGTVEGTEAVNFPIQAGGAYLMIEAIKTLRRTLDASIGEKILIQCHDELVCEGPDPISLHAKMETAMAQTLTLDGHSMRFSIDAAVGLNWADCREACLTCRQVQACALNNWQYERMVDGKCANLQR